MEKRLIRIQWWAFALGVTAAICLWLLLHAPQRDAQAGTGAGGTEHMQAETIKAAGIDGDKTKEKLLNENSTPSSTSLTNDSPAVAAAKPSVAAARLPALPSTVRVYLTKQRRIEKVPLETYVRGVVAGEMPPDFDSAALEAQALAARTYIVRRLLLGDTSGVPTKGADVTDTQTHQVYRSLGEMNRLREKDETAWRKATEAAYRTKGRVIVYGDEPIQALYFSTSNGYTENSENVFSNSLPYLRAVESPWDREGAPRSEETVDMPLAQFYDKLGIRAVAASGRMGGAPALKVAAWTEGHRVKTLSVGGKSIPGTEVREKLGLRSAAFSWRIQGKKIALTTFGSGHGVGMSQWGAQGMAKAGYTAEQIVKHYYTGTEIVEVSKLAKQLPNEG